MEREEQGKPRQMDPIIMKTPKPKAYKPNLEADREILPTFIHHIYFHRTFQDIGRVIQSNLRKKH